MTVTFDVKAPHIRIWRFAFCRLTLRLNGRTHREFLAYYVKPGAECPVCARLRGLHLSLLRPERGR